MSDPLDLNEMVDALGAVGLPVVVLDEGGPELRLGTPTPTQNPAGGWSVARSVRVGWERLGTVYKTPTGWCTWSGGDRFHTAEEAAQDLLRRTR